MNKLWLLHGPLKKTSTHWAACIIFKCDHYLKKILVAKKKKNVFFERWIQSSPWRWCNLDYFIIYYRVIQQESLHYTFSIFLPLKHLKKRLLYISAILYGWPCSRRPVGTRRRQLEWLTNFVLVVVSLMGCSVGAGLIGFYQLHLLSFISYEFFIIPLVLLGKAHCYSLRVPRVPGN